MANLFNLRDLSMEDITDILNNAQEFADGKTSKVAENKVIASLFFEPSTRTQQSFSMAALRLGAKVLTFNAESSSLQKGETFYDTVRLFEEIGSDALIIRHKENEYYKQLKDVHIPILSGGDGTGSHPTQSLLDLLTIKQEFGHFEGLKCCIAGDILHSRVAHTNAEVMERLGMKVYTSGPAEFKEEGYDYVDFDEAVRTMDVMMLLRIQKERLTEAMDITASDYNIHYGMTMERVRAMKDHSIIMHPAPFNRGVEIDDAVVECEKSRIFKQMHNGVFVRMAVIERAFTE